MVWVMLELGPLGIAGQEAAKSSNSVKLHHNVRPGKFLEPVAAELDTQAL